MGNQKRTYISDVVRAQDAELGKFNLICSGCGTGKSHFVMHTLLEQLPDVKPEEVIFVTSRAVTVEQQAKSQGVVKFDPCDINLINYWNCDERATQDVGSQIRLMTYDKIIYILKACNTPEQKTLDAIKVVIFDEVHTLFSDMFIQDMAALQVWIRDTIYDANKLLIGMTATPEILYYHAKQWGVSVKRLNRSTLMAHRAKQMLCTHFEAIPTLIEEHLQGKTLVLCSSVAACERLRAQIPNSAMLISKNNPKFTPEMQVIRDYIVEHERFPDTYLEPTDAELIRRGRGARPSIVSDIPRALKVLLVTTTAREGYNLREDSGVRNIISCYGDSLHLAQIAGRARYDLDMLVVAKTRLPYDNYNTKDFLAQQRKLFEDYLSDPLKTEWCSTVEHLVQHDMRDTKRFILGSDVDAFVRFVDEKWLVPAGATELEQKSYRLWMDEDKQELVAKCIACKMFHLPKRDITFQRVISLLENHLGYEVMTGRLKQDGVRYTYKLIVGRDETQGNYIPAFPGVSDLADGKSEDELY